MKKSHLPPVSLAIIVANALPVYGAYLGELNFFQVLYLFWFESVLLIFFDCLRIASAQGRDTSGFVPMKINGILQLTTLPDHYSVWYRLRLMGAHFLTKMGLLLFYLLFIVVFVAFQVSGKDAGAGNMNTVIFRNDYFNGAVLAFLVSMSVQYIAGFLLNGRYKRDSPLSYTGCFDARTILIHVMLIGSVFIHKFLFEGKSYERKGELVYVGLFMLAKTLVDIWNVRKEAAASPEEEAGSFI